MSESNSYAQKEYLKRYLSGNDGKKKKKKNVSSNTVKRSKIIDDDIDLKSMRPLEDDEVELYQMDEDAPQIVGIIDERPLEVKAQEQYSSKRWKVFGGDDGVNVVDNIDNNQSVSDKLSVMSKELDRLDTLDKKGVSKKVTEIDKRDNKLKPTNVIKGNSSNVNSSDSDHSSVGHFQTEVKSLSKQNSVQKKYDHNDSDESIQRQKKHQSSRHDDSDLSLPRNDQKSSARQKYDSDPSPPRKDLRGKTDRHHRASNAPGTKRDERKSYNRRHSDTDNSPQRRHSIKKLKQSYKSPSRRDDKTMRYRNDYDNSLPRKYEGKNYKYKSDSDNSPSRREKQYGHTHKSDSDISPPRRREKGRRLKNKYDNMNTFSGRTKRKSSTESDTSSPRRDRKRSPNHKNSSSRSNTPPTKSVLLKTSLLLNKPNTATPRLSRKDLMNEKNVKRHFSDSDDSPPRRRSSSFFHDGSASDLSPSRKLSLKKENPLKKPLYKPDDNSSSDEISKSKSKKMKTTLDGKKSGLQEAKQLRKELSDLRMKEDIMFSKMDASVSGVGAAPIKRDRKTGQVRDIEKEKEAQKEKEAKASIVNEKYYKWGKGLKQVEDAAERAADAMKEMNKPLARYVDDADLDNYLKAQEREGDPMLDYIKQKQREATPLVGVKPIYKGSYNPNRFGIRPGHRWDGVVRSSGYEKEWFSQQNAKRARDDEAYKWSTSDM